MSHNKGTSFSSCQAKTCVVRLGGIDQVPGLQQAAQEGQAVARGIEVQVARAGHQRPGHTIAPYPKTLSPTVTEPLWRLQWEQWGGSGHDDEHAELDAAREALAPEAAVRGHRRQRRHPLQHVVHRDAGALRPKPNHTKKRGDSPPSG